MAPSGAVLDSESESELLKLPDPEDEEEDLEFLLEEEEGDVGKGSGEVPSNMAFKPASKKPPSGSVTVAPPSELYHWKENR